MQDINLSDAIKAAFFEKLENEYDLQVIKDYEAHPPEKFYSFDEALKELGLDDER